MSSPLYVTASFLVSEDGLGTMRELLTALCAATRQEPGCLEYGYYQSLDNPLEISSFEIWQDPESEARHWQTPHLQQALTRAAGLLQDVPRIHRFQRLV